MNFYAQELFQSVDTDLMKYPHFKGGHTFGFSSCQFRKLWHYTLLSVLQSIYSFYEIIQYWSEENKFTQLIYEIELHPFEFLIQMNIVLFFIWASQPYQRM